MKRKGSKPENAPLRLWMLDIPGGYIEVSDLYLWIKFPNSKKIQYRLDGKCLYDALKTTKERRYLGELEIWSHDLGEETAVVIEPKEEADFQFQFEVSQNELKEALYCFVG